jgi:hypothetical protein
MQAVTRSAGESVPFTTITHGLLVVSLFPTLRTSCTTPMRTAAKEMRSRSMNIVDASG